MKTLYLHIGTPKTATSSLQKFCLMNQHRFQKYNYAFPLVRPKYPNVPIQRNAHFLVDSSPRYGEDGTLEKPGDDAPEKQAPRQKRLTDGLDTIHDAFHHYDNVILTDESLWISFCYNQKNPLDILCEDAKTEDYRIRVIVYLRRQDQYLTSRWNQFVKHSCDCRTFQEYLDDVLLRWPLIADYAEALDRIAQKTGKDNVIVRRFEASSWAGGSVYTDFLNALGLDHCADFQYPAEEKNAGLTLNYAEIQRQLNCSNEIPRLQKEFLSRCLRKASDICPKHTEYSFFSAAETKKFLAGYEEGNSRVAREYLGETGPLFSEPIAETKKWEPWNEHMGEDLGCYLSLLATTAFGFDAWKFKYKKMAKSWISGKETFMPRH
ncbi:MAG: hypothetical protein LUI39_05035 [Lachnospiraceae bacterium]|nr:hypothetical protein [Lachnospiraceae bacterium]